MTTPSSPRETHGDALRAIPGLLLALSCMASVPLFLRYLTQFDTLDAWTVNAVRYGTVAGIWLPFAILRSRRFPAERRVWRDARGTALANLVGQICWAIGAYYNEAGVIAFVVRSSFLFSAVYSVALLPAERATVRRPRFWLGAAGVALGLVLLFGEALKSGKSSPKGLFILLVAAAAWGLYWVLVKRDLGGHDQRLCFAVNSIYTAGALIVAMFLFGDWPALAGVPPRLWGVLVVSAIVGLVFSHVLMYRTIQIVGPVVTSGSTCIQPFLTTLGAWFFLEEILLPTQWAGGCLLVGSSLLLLSLKLGPQPVLPPITLPVEAAPAIPERTPAP